MIAALSASHLAALALTAGLRRLYVTQDSDYAGMRAAAALIERVERAGIEPIALSPRSDDFNGDLRQIGCTELAAWVQVQLASEDIVYVRYLQWPISTARIGVAPQ